MPATAATLQVPGLDRELSHAEAEALVRDDPAHADTLKQHRARLNRWIEQTGDLGPETPDVYILETEDQIKSTRNEVSREAYRRNAELYKRWAREGH